jgi:hypothetical protein
MQSDWKQCIRTVTENAPLIADATVIRAAGAYDVTINAAGKACLFWILLLQILL